MNAKMSKNFDKRLLNSMVGKQIPVDSFEEELKKIFRAKSRKNLWWSNIPTWIKDAEDNKYHKVNYRCCPEGDSRYLFCIHIKKDFLCGRENTGLWHTLELSNECQITVFSKKLHILNVLIKYRISRRKARRLRMRKKGYG